MVRSLALALVVTLAPTGLWADGYAVGITDDSGPGTLRFAMEQANAHAGADWIEFNPALSGAVIRPQSPLPTLTDDGTTIDGDVLVDGAPHVVLDGRDLATGKGLTITGDGCVVHGLAVVRFPEQGVFLNNADNCRISGCHIGVNLAGTATSLNGQDQLLLLNADGNTIGGTAAADRNVVAGATGLYGGIFVWGGNNNRILGNYLGIRRSGSAVLGAGRRAIGIDGLSGGGSGNRIGGTAAGAGNLIGGVQDGVGLSGAQGTRILGNTFGLLADGSRLAPITGLCIVVHDGSTGTVIGGLTAGARNVFAGGALWGIEVFGNGTRGTRIMGNYFGSNKPGTRRRSLTNGVLVSLGAGTQTIGGTDPHAGNYFTPSTTVGTNRGVRIESTPAVVRNNTFGTLANGGGVGGMSSAVALLDSTASILDNNIAHASDEGIRVDGAASNPKVFGNRFRDCWTAVRMDAGARCQLGNLGNASVTDDGGNVFAATNDRFIYNNTANAVKAEGNSFSTNSRAAIDAKIWDHRDNASLGRVDFDPLAGGVHPSGDAGSLQITNAAALAGRGGAEIVFSLSAPGEVSVHVLNVAGRLVATPLEGAPSAAGTQRITWSRRTVSGLVAPPGAYIVRIRARCPDGQRSDAVCLLRLGP